MQSTPITEKKAGDNFILQNGFLDKAHAASL
jgi:hypothetical protein